MIRKHLTCGLTTTRGRHRAKTAVVAAALAGLLASCGSSADSGSQTDAAGDTELSTMRLATTATVSTLAVWVADEKGFFQKRGLDVEVDIVNTTTLSQIPVLLGKQYDIGTTTAPNFLNAIEKGMGIVASSGSVTFKKEADPSINVLATKKSGITSPKDLEGKRLAAPSLAGNINLATIAWLKENGVDVSKVEIVQANGPTMPDLLKAGKIDAAEMNMPFTGILLSEGFVDVGYPLAAVADPVHMSFWVSEKKWAQDNKKDLANFRAAIDDAAGWIEANKDEALSIVMTKTNQPDEYRNFVSLPTYTSAFSVNDLEVWAAAMKSVNGFTTDKNFGDMVVVPAG